MNSPSPDHVAPDATDAAAYRCWRDDTVRFNDLDPLSHLTSVAFMIMFETARILFVRTAGEASGIGLARWMLVNANIDYLSQIHFPAQVRIGTRLQRMGRSSVTTVQGMFTDGRCAATLVSTMIFADPDLEGSTPLPEDLKRHLQALSDTGEVPST